MSYSNSERDVQTSNPLFNPRILALGSVSSPSTIQLTVRDLNYYDCISVAPTTNINVKLPPLSDFGIYSKGFMMVENVVNAATTSFLNFQSSNTDLVCGTTQLSLSSRGKIAIIIPHPSTQNWYVAGH